MYANYKVLSDPASKRLGRYSYYRIRNALFSFYGTKNVAIYAFSSGKILYIRKIAGVKNMTNIMSDGRLTTSGYSMVCGAW